MFALLLKITKADMKNLILNKQVLNKNIRCYIKKNQYSTNVHVYGVLLMKIIHRLCCEKLLNHSDKGTY